MITSTAQADNKDDLFIACKVYCQITGLNTVLPEAVLVRSLFLLASDMYIKPSNGNICFSSCLLKK